jgi:hypothetical protein
MIIKLTCKLGTRNIKIVSVDTSSPIYVLFEKLKISDKNAKFIFNGSTYCIGSAFTFEEIGLNKDYRIIISNQAISGGCWYNKEINIKFIKVSTNNCVKINNSDLFGLLKLCLLKEISSKLDRNRLEKLPDIIRYIMEVLQHGYIENKDVKQNIKDILEKVRGSSIINFSNYVDEIFDANQVKVVLNLLSGEELKEINDIKYRLAKYNNCIKLFDKEFEKTKRGSIFEFSIISLVVIEREDFDTFENEREKCPNRVERILYHGTSIEPISCILTGLFRRSEYKCYQHGKGVYFTDVLDYCWYYGGAESNRANKNIIPKVDDTFTLIASSIYYNKDGFKKVNDWRYDPKKNEINFAYADAEFETLIEPDEKKFFGTEYVIWDLNQICPFISAKLKRNEYCVIWRDNNFSSEPVYNNEFDEIFKKFLKERMKYINQNAKYNICPCQTSQEALNLIKRKKYNKIILISNVGTDLGGKHFINEARKIIGNDVIALFLAYNKSHLDWIKNYPNAIFSNEPKFYEEYLECFNDNYNINGKIRDLISKLENHYDVKFNFNDKFLDFPYYKESGKYSDLTF